MKRTSLLQTFEFYTQLEDGTETIVGVGDFKNPDRSKLWEETQSRLDDKNITRCGYRVIHEDPKTILRRKKLKRIL